MFGGVRDKRDKKDIVIEEKISRKLFFLNALEITAGVSEGEGTVFKTRGSSKNLNEQQARTLMFLQS